MTETAEDLYLGREYARRHSDWHLADASGKAHDLAPAVSELLPRLPEHRLRLADIGAGCGGVLHEICCLVRNLAPEIEIYPEGYEISPAAVELAARSFPELTIHRKPFDSADGPFDAVLLADVLEHLENPWELLRKARSASRYLLIRQPLLESFSTFRHDNYRAQRHEWGHIGFFTYRSFLDMAAATGWSPVKIRLAAPWELGTARSSGGVAHRLLCRSNRPLASYFISGFYLNGLFEAR